MVRPGLRPKLGLGLRRPYQRVDIRGATRSRAPADTTPPRLWWRDANVGRHVESNGESVSGINALGRVVVVVCEKID